MARALAKTLALSIVPLTAERWADFETLFGKNGACAGCWCMWWLLPHAQWTAQKGEGNRRAMRLLVKRNQAPGLLACADGKSVGWCAVAPRERYLRLANSRVRKPVDDEPVWSATCFFVAKEYRRRGVTVGLLKTAADYAREYGANILEGYPTDTNRQQADAFVYTGLASAFRRAGFKVVARRSLARPIMRPTLKSVRKWQKKS